MKKQNDLEKKEMAIWVEVAQVKRTYFNSTLLLTIMQYYSKDGLTFDVPGLFVDMEGQGLKLQAFWKNFLESTECLVVNVFAVAF